ncbi:MAG TPA: sigma-70 family RNA polymerase sigma factor [Verrucomicrobiae bacterium]
MKAPCAASIMKDADHESIPTRPSLLGRLADWEDQQSWEEFCRVYSRLIRRTAMRAGLSETEAQDVEQETLLQVARNIRKFQPAGGSFKGWLLNQVRWRVGDHFRHRAAEEKYRQHAHRCEEENPTPTEERIAVPPGVDGLWEEEWEKTLIEQAVGRVCRRANPKHAQILDLCVLRGQSVSEVARALDVSLMTVYLVKTRLGQELKREVDRLRQTDTL